jgi:hypothetical protein
MDGLQVKVEAFRKMRRAKPNIAAARASNVIQFPQRQRSAFCLTPRDRQDVAELRIRADAAGYDTLMIHVVVVDGTPGTTDYVAAYRAGERWSRWGFARSGNSICSWNALTSADAGTFSSMSEALGEVLLGAAKPRSAESAPAG